MNGHKTRIFFIVFIMSNIGFAVSVEPGSLGSEGKQLYINNLVGDTIDAAEAKYYRIFSDIEGFDYATFHDYESDESLTSDSMSKHIVVEIMRKSCFGTDESGDSAVIQIEKHVRIDHDAFQTLRSYILFFRDIATNDTLRRKFVKSHAIEWPVITAEEMDASRTKAKNNFLMNSACCIGTLGSTGAYYGALTGTEMTYHSVDACMGYYTYTVSPAAVYGMAAAGAGLGLIFSSALNAKYEKDIRTAALRRGIVAFDNYNMPITEQEVNLLSSDKSGDCIYAGCGTTALLSAVATGMVLCIPWVLMSPNDGLDQFLTAVPIVAVSGAEFGLFLKISMDYKKKRDRQAALERIKKKREEERLKRLNNSE